MQRHTRLASQDVGYRIKYLRSPHVSNQQFSGKAIRVLEVFVLFTGRSLVFANLAITESLAGPFTCKPYSAHVPIISRLQASGHGAPNDNRSDSNLQGKNSSDGTLSSCVLRRIASDSNWVTFHLAMSAARRSE